MAAVVLLVPMFGEAGAATTVTIIADADSSVAEAHPSANYGGASSLRVDGTHPVTDAYLRFDLSGASDPIGRATLRVFVENGGQNGFEVHGVADSSWDETSLTWSNAPPLSPVVAESGSVEKGQWASIDVTELAQAGALVSVAMTTLSSSPLTLASREAGAAQGPRLLVEPTAVLPANTVLPSISGQAIEGETLSAAAGSWTGTPPISFAYQWLRCDSAGANCAGIGGATGETHALTSVDVGSTIRVHVTATNSAGSASESSAPTPAVLPAPTPADTSPPSAPSGLAVGAVTLSSIALSWSPSIDDVGVAGYGVFVDGSQVDATNATTYIVSDLACGTTYALSVAAYDAAGNQSPPSAVNASTAPCLVPPPPSISDPVIAAGGDICNSPTSCAGTADLLDAINPDAVLTLGDNAYDSGTLDEYNDYYRPNWGRHDAKVYPNPGNHEYNTTNAQGYFDYFGVRAPAAYYSYDLGSWHLISLNSELPVAAGSLQETWLKVDLATHPAKCVLAYWHRPRFSSGAEHGSDSTSATLWNDLYAAGADIVLNGHEHNYERFTPQNPSGEADANGIREFVVGTGGASHYGFSTPLPNSEVRDSDSFGVLKLTLHPGSYDWKFVPAAGSSFTDSGSWSCH